MHRLIASIAGFKRLIPLLLSAPLCAASLQFETHKIGLKAPVEASETVAHFRFTNNGEAPVRIRETRSSCGCTTIKPTQETYAPGAQGEITAVFDHGTRKGKQHKSIYLVTEEPGEQVYTLSLDVEIPVALEIRPIILFWKADETAAKTADIRISPEFDVVIKGVRNLNPTWQVTLRATDNEGHHRLTVAPVGDVTGQRGTVLIDTEVALPGGGVKSEQHFLYLRAR